MKYKNQFRSGLQRGLVLAVPLAMSFQCESQQAIAVDANSIRELSFTIHPEGEFAKELALCLADDDACVELCDRILVQHGHSGYPGEAVIHECVASEKESLFEVEMSVSYPYPMAVGCGVVSVDPNDGQTSVGSHFAAMAELEAASVYAFVRMARDLQQHDAPKELVRSALRAAADEVRHTAQASSLASAWGGKVRQPKREDYHDRELSTLCLENAVDSCVYETFGAKIAMLQGQNASDPYIRSVMASVAQDEMRHAELARAIDHWARPKLGYHQRVSVENAARQASHVLATVQNEAPKNVTEIAGFPSATTARGIARSLERKRRQRWS